MKTLFEKETLTNVVIENGAGLPKGSIKSMTIYPDGAVEIETENEIPPTTQVKIRAILESYQLIKGKKERAVNP